MWNIKGGMIFHMVSFPQFITIYRLIFKPCKTSASRSIENLSNLDSDGEQIPDIPAQPNHDHSENNSVRSNIDKIKQVGAVEFAVKSLGVLQNL